MDATESVQRAAVIAEAYAWRDTPFINGAKVKGAGVDCAMLIEAIFEAVGLVDEAYPEKYSSQWHLHRGEEKYLDWVRRFAVEVEAPRPGDVGVWQFGRCFAHAGVFVDGQHVIHAWSESGRVVKSPVRMGSLSVRLGANGPEPRPVKYFDVWAKRRG
jgi:cell wall-associated NlpC family hydrolase